ncbi:MAG: ATP-binding protein [Pseudomonadota bacterium]
MRFGLRRQLLAIGLVTLALPVASALYLRETEQALRSAQAGFLNDLARGLAPLVPAVDALSPTGRPDEALYAHPLPATPTLDGFSTDWRLRVAPAPAAVGGDQLGVLVGERDGTVWLAAEARHAATDAPRFDVACGDDQGGLVLTTIAPIAPGAVLPATTASGFAGRIRGDWQPTADGSRLELRLPAGLCHDRLGLSVRAGERSARTYRDSIPGALIRIDATLRDALATNALPGIETFVVNQFGYRITPVIGARTGGTEAPQKGVAQRLIAGLMGGDADADATVFEAQAHRPVARTLEGALAGNLVAARYAAPGGGLLLVDARPLAGGALVMVQDAEAILTLANPSLQRLTTAIIVTTLAVVLLLLAYASWLSWRVRRLARHASLAVDAHGQIQDVPPDTATRDEIGDLARDMREMLKRTAEQQRWLAAMADTLSHELRTPLAIVQSSLDNLEQGSLDDGQRQLTDRAADGVLRLRAILNAVSNASRAEQAARTADTAPVALAPLIAQLRDAYAATFPSHTFELRGDTSPTVIGTAELLVQALDKLVENAVRFAPEGSTIRLELETHNAQALVQVRNEGPALPKGDPGRLFDSFVSTGGTGSTHLGFGLYIARLIVEAHGGGAAAADWVDDAASGVVVTLRLPLVES